MDWLHWIGKKYYSIDEFLEEGKRVGVSRRVSLNFLARMNWGDKVYCIQKKPKYRNGSVFCCFPVKLLTGLSSEICKELCEVFPMEKISEGGEIVERECGDYVTGSSYEVKVPLKTIVSYIIRRQKEGVDIGKPMVGCDLSSFRTLVQPWAIMKNIPFSQGFRDFDFNRFISLWQSKLMNDPKHEPQLRGRFRTEVAEKKTRKGNVQEVKNYRKKD